MAESTKRKSQRYRHMVSKEKRRGFEDAIASDDELELKIEEAGFIEA